MTILSEEHTDPSQSPGGGKGLAPGNLWFFLELGHAVGSRGWEKAEAGEAGGGDVEGACVPHGGFAICPVSNVWPFRISVKAQDLGRKPRTPLGCTLGLGLE